MKTARFFSIMMLCGLGATAAAPVVNTTLDVKVSVPPAFSGIISFNSLNDKQHYQSETFFVKTDQPTAAFSRKLPASTQIIYLNSCPLLVNAGDQVKAELLPKYTNLGKVMPGRFRLAGNGKDANRQVLPYLIDSLYASAAVTTTQQADEFIKDASAQVAKLISAAKVSKADNLAALKAFEQSKQLLLRINVATPIKTPSTAKELGDWCLNGFDCAAPAFSAIGDEGIATQVEYVWMLARKLQDSTLTDNQLIVEGLLTWKADRIKEKSTIGWMTVEGRQNAYTPDLKVVYETAKATLKPGSLAMHTIDSLYNSYLQMKPGTPAYNFALKNDNGDLVRLSDFKGKIVIIDIWAMWCHGCVAALPTFRKLADSYKDKKDIVFLTIAWEEPSAPNKAILKKFSIDHHIEGENNLFLSSDRSDPQAMEFINRYCLNSITRWVAIDDKGNILDGNMGYPTPDNAFEQKVANCYKARN
ncbi:TlpA family protein disulfide reductase [Chitinophaga eiseniae]|uniref:TlpA family protein disulfide reductase n=1 Tax=Chitinophaga eiseniae TaxID=634771 RepID=A0A847S8L0_9BACT|nr:TlpA disulfide reductase family protein [Chitinophaga eiseniae]NLR78131.1 TlpA family protein disulfide reductase [Chitinophaga eiseniae]